METRATVNPAILWWLNFDPRPTDEMTPKEKRDRPLGSPLLVRFSFRAPPLRPWQSMSSIQIAWSSDPGMPARAELSKRPQAPRRFLRSASEVGRWLEGVGRWLEGWLGGGLGERGVSRVLPLGVGEPQEQPQSLASSGVCLDF